ncbi:SLATT domain-containing protein [Hyphomicrobium sulfonivorans]|uniref:SLATT domain-containing protein n=1 Tax=Hyphomicrobium sulfonivorans TaxID=121290 RepID=UPI00156F534B|nr:SLATT domain-containing protein [Hyphomicrobium sulfonivorans]MBI1649346.1 SLATT domain-containing protein [Hyphomicrobium sulfonivorans]
MQTSRIPTASGATQIRLAAETVRKNVSTRDRYLNNWNVVKRARFNAAKRFERKQDASTLAFALAGVFGFLLPIYTTIFQDSISVHTRNVLDFTGFVTGSLSMVIGLIEQAKDYPAKARRFDECGRKVNSALQRLTLMNGVADRELQPILEEYERALHECGENHDEIDYEIARSQQALSRLDQQNLEPEKLKQERLEQKKKLAALRRREAVQIFGLYWAIWIGPLLLSAMLLLLVPPGQNAASATKSGALPDFTGAQRASPFRPAN